MEVTIILCNIKRRILSYRKQLSNTSIFKNIHDLMHQKYRPRSFKHSFIAFSITRCIYTTYRYTQLRLTPDDLDGSHVWQQHLSSFTPVCKFHNLFTGGAVMGSVSQVQKTVIQLLLLVTCTVKPVDRERVLDQKFCSEYTIVP